MNPSFEKPFTFDRTVRLVISVAICVVLFLLLKRLSGVILPFLAAWLFAYMIYPLVKFFQYKLKVKYRAVAIILALITIFGTITVFVYALKPLIRYEYLEMKMMVSNFINNTTSLGPLMIPPEWLDALKNMLGIVNADNFFTTDNLIQVLEKVSPRLWQLITGSFNFIVSMFIVFIVLLYIFFLLLDYEQLERGWVKLVPKKYRNFASELATDVRVGMNKYFRSQALIAMIVGILFAIGFKIIDFPLGITLGLFIGVLNLVPYLQTLGLFPMALFAAIKAGSENENFFLIFLSALAVLAVVQIIQDMILVPNIMGHTTGLKPAVILLALSIWGALLGVVGMIIALPMTTLIISYYKRFILGEPEDPLPLETTLGSRKLLLKRKGKDKGEKKDKKGDNIKKDNTNDIT